MAGTLTLATPARGTVTYGRYGSAIVGSTWHRPGIIEPGDGVKLEDPHYLTASSSSRGTLS